MARKRGEDEPSSYQPRSEVPAEIAQKHALVMEVLARPLWLAPGTPAAARAARMAPPAPTGLRPSAALENAYWTRLLAGDRAGACAESRLLWLRDKDALWGLTPLWALPPGSPEREAWLRTLRASWRYHGINAPALAH